MDSDFYNDFRVFKDSVISSYSMLHNINIDYVGGNNSTHKKYETKIKRNAMYMDVIIKDKYVKDKVNNNINFLDNIELDFLDKETDEYLISLVQKEFDKKYKKISAITDVILYGFYIFDNYYIYIILRGTIKKRKCSFLKLGNKSKKYKLNLKLNIFCVNDKHI